MRPHLGHSPYLAFTVEALTGEQGRALHRHDSPPWWRESFSQPCCQTSNDLHVPCGGTTVVSGRDKVSVHVRTKWLPCSARAMLSNQPVGRVSDVRCRVDMGWSAEQGASVPRERHGESLGTMLMFILSWPSRTANPPCEACRLGLCRHHVAFQTSRLHPPLPLR